MDAPGPSRLGTDRAAITLEAWKNGDFAAADTAWAGTGSVSARAWTRVLLDIDVPDDATIHSIVIGALLDGAGSAWFDDLSLSVDGRRITTLPVEPPPPSGKDLAWLASRSAPLFPDSGLAAFDVLVGSADHHRPGRIDAWHARVLRDEGATGRASRADAGRARLRDRGEPARGRTHQPVSCRVGRAARAMRWACCSGCGTPRRCWRWSSGSGRGTSIMPARWCALPGSTCRITASRRYARVPSWRGSSRRLSAPFDSLIRRVPGTGAIHHAVDSRLGPGSVAASGGSAAGGGEREARGQWLSRASSGEDSASVEWAVQGANLYRQAARLNASLNSPERGQPDGGERRLARGAGGGGKPASPSGRTMFTSVPVAIRSAASTAAHRWARTCAAGMATGTGRSAC